MYLHALLYKKSCRRPPLPMTYLHPARPKKECILSPLNVLVLHLLTVKHLQNTGRYRLDLLLRESDMSFVEVDNARQQPIITMKTRKKVMCKCKHSPLLNIKQENKVQRDELTRSRPHAYDPGEPCALQTHRVLSPETPTPLEAAT